MLQQIPTRPADHRVTLAQIGPMTLASVGARDIVRDDPNGLVQFRYGGGRKLRKVIVRLAADDTYRVETGHMPRTGPNAYGWVVETVEDGVHAAELSEAVRRITGC